ncbi:Por secretion system C-terminal sorting domain-containing protein [Chryseobacterium oleae]|uniref:Por secretion system C-terminal sorting domain-containing protein n=1 Tax=Chryseobacterium oleae TaxID=491207 RepID=A0A1I5BRA1_CHROL|nr:photosystem II stability/assembly factor-like protein [Chryseobacterium oleae]SFN77217.1 Por secretion system C-terminal sorting domain-containing protein [Chryseobacterium oleae]
MRKILFIFSLLSSLMQAQYSWTAFSYPPSNGTGRYDDVFFLNENLGWAARGGNGAVFKTTNGGNTWVQKAVTGPANQYYRNIEFLNENVGFLGTLNNSFYKTVDGGESWQKVNNISPYPEAICGLDCVGTSTVYGCGAWFSPAYIIKSTDSGNTWEYIDMSAYANALVEITFINENVGFVSGNDNDGAVILKTLDGGASWTKIYNSNIASEFVWKMQLLENNKIFCAIESEATNAGKLLKSVNGGFTWETKDFPDPYVQAVGFVSETHGWMGGHSTGFYETLDGGNTWMNTGVGGSLNRIFFVNNNLAFAAGSNIYKMTRGTLDVKENPGESQERKLKVEVAPNPVKDKLNLNVYYVHTDHIVVGLYEASGKFIKNILKDDISAKGLKKYSLDFNYPKGNYLLDVHSNLGRQSIKIIK